MITLSLDENGAFEKIDSDKTGATFIAGLLYDDCGIEGETEWERQRIAEYYKSAINEAGKGQKYAYAYKYPNALHFGHGSDLAIANVKKTVLNSFNEFITKGTFEGSELLKGHKRMGKYYIYCILKSNDGMSALLNRKANRLVNDGYASNLYFHMATEIVSRLMVHNPLLRNISDFSMDIATRRTPDFIDGSKEANEYKRLGYKINEVKSEERDEDAPIFDVAENQINEVKSQERNEKRFISVSQLPILIVPLYHSR